VFTEATPSPISEASAAAPDPSTAEKSEDTTEVDERDNHLEVDANEEGEFEEEVEEEQSEYVDEVSYDDDAYDAFDDESARLRSLPTPTCLQELKREDRERSRLADGRYPWQVRVRVPEGVGEDRRVRVNLQNMELDAQLVDVCCPGMVAFADLPLEFPLHAQLQHYILYSQILSCRLRYSYDASLRQYCTDGDRKMRKVRAYRRLRGRCMIPQLSQIVEDWTAEVDS